MKLLPRPLAVLLACALTACGGAGGGGDFLAGGGTGGTGVSSGPITGFGSIFVTGIEYELAGATILVNGTPMTEEDLRLGMYVRVERTNNSDGRTGTATRVEYDSEAEGPVGAVDAAAGTLVVLGRTVRVDALTVFDGVDDLAGILAGHVIEISGSLDADGTLLATRIEVEGPDRDGDGAPDTDSDGDGDIDTDDVVIDVNGDGAPDADTDGDGDIDVDTDGDGIADEEVEITTPAEVAGVVSGHDALAQTFFIGVQKVDYAPATLSNLPTGIADGLTVEVHGALGSLTGVLTATTVAGQSDDPLPDDGDEAAVEGLITRFVSATDFDVNGTPVTTDTGTVYEFGTSADLALNVKVHVAGIANSAGTILADEVEFKDLTADRGAPGEIGIKADVETVDATNRIVTLLGLAVHTDSGTIFVDEREPKVARFGFAHIAIGDRLEVEAFRDAAGLVMAEKIVRKKAEGDLKIEGPVDAADGVARTLTVAGVPVTTNAGTDYENAAGAAIDAATFFTAAAADGARAEAQGVFTGGTLLAEELGLE